MSVSPAARCAQLLDRLALGVGGELVDERMLGRHDGVGHAETGVGPGGEDPHRQASGRPSTARSNSAPSERPIQLRCMVLTRSGHSRSSRAARSSSAYAVMRKNHCSRSRFDQVARALAGAVGQDLLVGQHRLAAGAPVDRGQGPVGQAGLPEPQEDDLVPLDVRGVVAAHLAAPVVDRAEPDERGRQLGDPGLGEEPGVGAGLDGGVLGREPEGVEPDGAEDALALHGLVANDQVTEGVVAHVALVGRPGGVGVHAQGVELLAGVVVVDLVRAVVVPVALPLALHRFDVVGACHATRVREAGLASLSRVRREPAGLSDGPSATSTVARRPPRSASRERPARRLLG